ncbi:MAG: KH domain-containing protein [archaeon]|nr:KH domain-containing protein [archaeon]
MWHRDGPLLSIEAANKDSFRVDLVNGELPPAKRGRRRRATSRWDQQSQDPEQRAAVGRGHRGFPERMEGQLPPEVAHALAVRVRLEELSAILTGEEPLRSEEGRAERSPSPPPTYDGHGKRDNTRESRKRTLLQRERQYAVDHAGKLCPGFKPPADFKPVQLRSSTKVYIPFRQYPDYNFIGIIIGPRGQTQKELEAATGAKIAIRGRGSTKDGRGAGKNQDDDELHVLITAETDGQMKAAIKRVEQLLVPVDEGKNEHKRQQLRKLAEYNGTLRETTADQVRARFHDQHAVPSVKCSICGETSHPTIDCPAAPSANDQPPVLSQELDDAYAQFKAMLDAPSALPAPHPHLHPHPHPHPHPHSYPAAEPQDAPWNSSTHQTAPVSEEMPPWMASAAQAHPSQLPPLSQSDADADADAPWLLN